mmetsp:Transcript_117808/g.186546  ORF Transcript_117808/g.186546 Transcript_117808/m.186546 type:complete len:87 (-) Transcript_117808:505-765(-)
MDAQNVSSFSFIPAVARKERIAVSAMKYIQGRKQERTSKFRTDCRHRFRNQTKKTAREQASTQRQHIFRKRQSHVRQQSLYNRNDF